MKLRSRLYLEVAEDDGAYEALLRRLNASADRTIDPRARARALAAAPAL